MLRGIRQSFTHFHCNFLVKVREQCTAVVQIPLVISGRGGIIAGGTHNT
jgi:hypothetical protein